MRQLLESNEMPVFLDETARRFLDEGRKAYAARALADEFVIDQGREVQIMTWLGDASNEVLACLLRCRGHVAAASGPGIEVTKGTLTTEAIVDALMDAGIDDPPPLEVLLGDAENLRREKWDWALPDPLLRKAYVSLHLDLDEALSWVKAVNASRLAAGLR